MNDNTNNKFLDLSVDVLDGDLFKKLPESYYNYALQWCVYPKWTIEETANLLTGCVPHRPMFLKGNDHKVLDEEVLNNENKIRLALNKELQTTKSKKYFASTYIKAGNILSWARTKGIVVPVQLMNASREVGQENEAHGYTTPMLEAARWVVENYWQNGDLREPPTEGEIIQAILREFPELSGAESEIVEQVCRHPYARLSPT